MLLPKPIKTIWAGSWRDPITDCSGQNHEESNKVILYTSNAECMWWTTQLSKSTPYCYMRAMILHPHPFSAWICKPRSTVLAGGASKTSSRWWRKLIKASMAWNTDEIRKEILQHAYRATSSRVMFLQTGIKPTAVSNHAWFMEKASFDWAPQSVIAALQRAHVHSAWLWHTDCTRTEIWQCKQTTGEK